MRIIGGELKGRKLYAPKGMNVRPTADRVKEALFNILGPAVVGARVLDLFAGAGSLGLEALSRGAERAVFVENHPGSIEAIKRNIESLSVGRAAKIIKVDLTRSLTRLKDEGLIDLVFIDPPYGKHLIPRVLTGIAGLGILKDDATAAAEFGSSEDVQKGLKGWELLQTRSYGQTSIAFLKLDVEDQAGSISSET